MEKIESSTKRIEYIDALRGFTMFLVIMSHVAGWGLNCDGYSSIFSAFRMPLFFFVSGFVFYKVDTLWNWEQTAMFLKKKFPVQIISPFLFLVAYVAIKNMNLLDSLLMESKAGYWFTFVLFEFFVIYIILQQIFKLLHIRGVGKDIAYVVIGLAMYILMHHKVIGHSAVVTTLSCVNWRYFIFFILGTVVKKYFQKFEQLLDYTPLVLGCIIIFVVLSIFPVLDYISVYITRLTLAVSGIVVVFAGFRHYQDVFSQEHAIGRIMQFVGRRTLDIYLLHYFFVYEGIAAVFAKVPFSEAPFMGFVCSLVISCCVIATCLFVSQILRLSPWLSHFLFGQKLNK